MNAPFLPRAGLDWIELVRDAARLSEIGPVWDTLWRCAGAPIFQSHAWISAWWTHLADHSARELLIVLAWRGDQLLAVLPLAIHRRLGLRMLEWAGRDVCDYCDALMMPGSSPDLLTRMWGEFCATTRFDVSLLNRLLPDARAWSLLSADRGARLRANRRMEHSTRVSGEWTDGAAWFDHFPKKIRQNYKRGVKFLEEGANLRFRLLPPETDLAPALAQLAAFKRLWLTKTGHVAPLFDEGAPLLPALAEVLAKAGTLRIFVLERDGAIIALSLNFMEGDSLLAFVTAYDPAFERGSPGMVLMMDYIRWAFDEGCREVDFLTGDEDFKHRFGAHEVPLASMAGAGSLLGRLVMLVDGMRERVGAFRRR
ncbi:MAG: GNAT family N-acetyltransferase [Rhizobiales bacterium]|nr:GNAT family N-acetyltransferase [Hyphomicrobiales bacterium]